MPSITDLPERVVINVTPEDIDRGIPGNAYECPIALACYRALNVAESNWTVNVGDSDDKIEVWQKGTSNLHKPIRRYATVDANLQPIIEHFDEDGVMSPFEFELRLFEDMT